MNKGDPVVVERAFWVDNYFHGGFSLFGSQEVACVCIRTEQAKCEKEKCRPNCEGEAVWVRTTGDQATWEQMVEQNHPSAVWHYSGYKVCTSYIVKPKERT